MNLEKLLMDGLIEFCPDHQFAVVENIEDLGNSGADYVG